MFLMRLLDKHDGAICRLSVSRGPAKLSALSVACGWWALQYRGGLVNIDGQ